VVVRFRCTNVTYTLSNPLAVTHVSSTELKVNDVDLSGCSSAVYASIYVRDDTFANGTVPSMSYFLSNFQESDLTSPVVQNGVVGTIVQIFDKTTNQPLRGDPENENFTSIVIRGEGFGSSDLSDYSLTFRADGCVVTARSPPVRLVSSKLLYLENVSMPSECSGVVEVNLNYANLGYPSVFVPIGTVMRADEEALQDKIYQQDHDDVIHALLGQGFLSNYMSSDIILSHYNITITVSGSTSFVLACGLGPNGYVTFSFIVNC